MDADFSPLPEGRPREVGENTPMDADKIRIKKDVILEEVYTRPKDLGHRFFVSCLPVGMALRMTQK